MCSETSVASPDVAGTVTSAFRSNMIATRISSDIPRIDNMEKKEKKDSTLSRVREYFTKLPDATFVDLVTAFPDAKRNSLSVYFSTFKKKGKKKKHPVVDDTESKIMEELFAKNLNIGKNNVPERKQPVHERRELPAIVEKDAVLEEEFIEHLHVAEEVEPEILENVFPERFIDVFKTCDTKIFKVANRYIKTARCISCRSVIASLDVTKEVNALLEKRKKGEKHGENRDRS